MKKKLCILILTICMLFSLSACSLEGLFDMLIDNVISYVSTTTTRNTNTYSSYENTNYESYTYYDLSRAANIGWYYLNSIGEQKILVIPVKIEHYTSYCDDQTLTDLETAFFSDGESMAFESLSSYYYKSSYGKLSITGEVLDWTREYKISELNTANEEQIILDNTYDFIVSCGVDPKEYDQDEDGYLDCVYYVYSSPWSDEDSTYKYDRQYPNRRSMPYSVPDYFWASSQNNDVEPNKARPQVNNYCFMSLDFFYQEISSNNYQLDSHTAIHEFGHLLGLDDYYYYESDADPVGYTTMMSNNVCDLDAFSKLALGWIEPIIVDTDTNVDLLSYSSEPTCVVLCEDKDKFSVFSNYILIEFYDYETDLNIFDSLTEYQLFTISGFYSLEGYIGPKVKGCRAYAIDARVGYYDSNDKIHILDTIKDYDPSLGDLSFVVHSNNEQFSLLSGSEARLPLIKILDANLRNYTNRSRIQDSNTFFTASSNKTFDSKNYTFNTTLSYRYTVSFSNQTDSSISLTIKRF